MWYYPGARQGVVLLQTEHLIRATLLQGDLFPQQNVKCPNTVLEITVEAYPIWTRPSSKWNCPSSMRTVSSRLAVVQCICTSSSWRTTIRALSQRLSASSRSSSPHLWQQLNLRDASQLWRGSRPSWETPWHRIARMLWLCSPWRRNLWWTFLTLITGSLRCLPLKRRKGQNSCTNKMRHTHPHTHTHILTHTRTHTHTHRHTHTHTHTPQPWPCFFVHSSP